jgi:hypothetical protein
MHDRTVDDDNNKRRRRLVEFKEGFRYGKFGRTKAYELIAHEKIRAYKMGGKTMIDVDSVDEYHARCQGSKREQARPPICAARRRAHRRAGYQTRRRIP